MNKKITLTITTVAILGGLFVFMKPKSVSHETPGSKNEIQGSLESSVPQVNVTLVVKDAAIIKGPKIINANEGDVITINATGDTNDEIHIHGLDQHLELEINKQKTITFKADKSGRFSFELEGEKKDLGEIDITPKI